MIKTYIFSVTFLFSLALLGQNCNFQGKLVNSIGEAIPYATIYLPESGISGMANENGDFDLKAPCGSQNVQFQSLGYQSKSIKLNSEENKSLTIQLQSVAYQLAEVTIDPNSEDPAYNIIRKATVMAEYYKKQITAYKTQIYVRSFYEIKEMPWLIKKMMDDEDLKDALSGDVSESILEYEYKRPNMVKENILAQKSAKTDSVKSGSSYINLNFYNIGGNSIINPLSRGAFHVYRFEYQNSFYVGNQKVHKIRIIPKRRGDDLMRGTLYINDGIWNINQVDVSFDQPMASIEYEQVYQKVSPIVWMPVTHKIRAKVKVMGVEVVVQYLASLKNLKVESDPIVDAQISANLLQHTTAPSDSIKAPNLLQNTSTEPKSKDQQKIESLIQKDKLTKRETFKLLRMVKKVQKEQDADSSNYEVNTNHEVVYSKSVNAANDSLWANNQSIPLSQEEINIYAKNDTLKNKSDTAKNINDSTKKSGLLYKILIYNSTLDGKNKNTSWQVKGLLTDLNVTFNTVDGWLLQKKLIGFRWENHKSRFLSLEPIVSYAFARERWGGQLDFNSQYNLKLQAGIYGNAGRRTNDYHSEPNFSPILNTISTLVFTSNYKKFFEEDFVNLGHRIEPLNGLKVDISAHYSDRKVLSNHSNQQLYDFMDKEYTNNVPPLPQGLLTQSIANNKNFNLKASINYTPKLYYRFNKYDVYKKNDLGSKLPTFSLTYEKGIPSVFESQSNYQFLSFSIEQKTPFRLINEIRYQLSAGTFLNTNTLNYADYKHFTTHPFYLMSQNQSMDFYTLDYFGFSSRKAFLEGHFSVEDNHLLLKYLPLLNRTNWTEKIIFSYLYTTDAKTNFYEAGYSLNGIFLFLNTGVYVGFKNQEFQSVSFRIGLNLELFK